jgi:hypothetical protein
LIGACAISVFHYEQYLAIVDQMLPKLIIERLTGVTLTVVQPDSLFAPM